MQPAVRSTSFALVASLLGAILPLSGCQGAKPPAPQPPTVQLIRPQEIPTLDSADYQSTLEAIREVRMAPEIDGRIVAMPVFEGQPVRRGQLLFVLDQIQLQSQVNADFAEARKDRVNAERYIFLNEQGAVSTKDRDYYVTQAIQSRDKLRAAAATLSYKNVVAPIDGFVGNLNAKLGDVVRAGSPVTSVVDNTRLWVRLDVPGELAWRLRPGLPVVLKAPDRRTQAGQPFVFLAVSPEEAKRRLGRTLDPPPLPGLPVALQVPVRLGTLQRGSFPVQAGLAPADTVIVGNLAQLRSGLTVQPKQQIVGR